MFNTVLRGARFRPLAAQEVLLALEADAPLTLEPEPDNPHDPNAIKVIDPESTHFIGYIAKEDCEDILGMMNVGPVVAKIGAINGIAPTIEVEHDFSDGPTEPEAA